MLSLTLSQAAAKHGHFDAIFMLAQIYLTGEIDGKVQCGPWVLNTGGGREQINAGSSNERTRFSTNKNGCFILCFV